MTSSIRGAALGLLAVAVISVAAEAQAASTAAQTPTRTPRHSWTSDRRGFQEGDVITVLIDEQTLAATLRGTSSSNSRSRDMSLGANQTIIDLPRIGADVSSSDASQSRSSGDLTRENRFQAEMTVRVVAVEPNGLLELEGKKMVNVDKNTEEITLTGFVRSEDVSTGNLVESWRLADAQLIYTTTGSLGNPKSGIISRILGILWP